jgi:hypothetical protein
MTLPLVDHDRWRRAEGPAYKVGPHCAHCDKWASDGHHLIRRSAISGPFDWVWIDGTVYQNVIGLCADCHHAITSPIGGHQAAIRLDEENGIFFWMEVVGLDDLGNPEYDFPFLLVPQPRTLEGFLAQGGGQDEHDACPTCGHVKRRRPPTTPSAPGRRRKSWTVKVPDDAEDGAEVLDTLVDDLGLLLDIEPTSASGRYYVLVPALYHCHQDRRSFVASLKGRGEDGVGTE